MKKQKILLKPKQAKAYVGLRKLGYSPDKAYRSVRKPKYKYLFGKKKRR